LLGGGGDTYSKKKCFSCAERILMKGFLQKTSGGQSRGRLSQKKNLLQKNEEVRCTKKNLEKREEGNYLKLIISEKKYSFKEGEAKPLRPTNPREKGTAEQVKRDWHLSRVVLPVIPGGGRGQVLGKGPVSNSLLRRPPRQVRRGKKRKRKSKG